VFDRYVQDFTDPLEREDIIVVAAQPADRIGRNLSAFCETASRALSAHRSLEAVSKRRESHRLQAGLDANTRWLIGEGLPFAVGIDVECTGRHLRNFQSLASAFFGLLYPRRYWKSSLKPIVWMFPKLKARRVCKEAAFAIPSEPLEEFNV